ncbi:hypothetical protein [Aestuariivirga sp.]|uniref:hypothetical protein n=1 Tax=Aestuariivirga sp. TaxID=2650926 RepID=UPI0025C29C82|nr:hypothetical protein [Aestuariivirga sp.]MCA3556339.1 hypothetical protein [Aestuariivirga sp.]
MVLCRATLFAAFACLTATFRPAAADVIKFKMPSNNVGCHYESSPKDVLRCLRYEPSVMGVFLDENDAFASRPEMWGPALVGEGMLVLQYGESLSLGGITCTSEQSGLTREGYGHGFAVSRGNIDTY